MEKIPFSEFVEAMLWYVENPDLTAYVVKVAGMTRKERLRELQSVEFSHLGEPSKQWLRMVLSGNTANRVVDTLNVFADAYGVSLY